jgi:hypothetical protein
VTPSGSIRFASAPDGAIVVQLVGAWSVHAEVGDAAPVLRALVAAPVAGVRYDCGGLTAWDSSILVWSR